MEQELVRIEQMAKKEIEEAHGFERIEEIRIAYIGRSGSLTAVLRGLKDLPVEERKRIGERANVLRADIEHLIAKRKEELERDMRASIMAREWVDATRPGIKPGRGHLHPTTQVMRDASAIFQSMGFATVEGPEVETEYYNFDALNIPANHPVREMWDTFWLRQNERKTKNEKRKTAQRLLLRTHTSPVQVRYMETHNPPIRIIVPGRVYRYEATDASHDIQFSQLEGLMVDKNVSIANFKAIMQEFFSRLFRQNVTISLRPSYFPFTEPSFEVFISCVMCGKKGCSVCKRSGWLELGGAGMVHPDVFKHVGYNPADVQGFAFGMGMDRVVMMRYKITDIRLMRAGDLRFLEQF